MSMISINLPAVVLNVPRKEYIGKKIIIVSTDMATKEFEFVWVDDEMKKKYGYCHIAKRESFEYIKEK